MDKFTPTDLHELMTTSAEMTVSIYIPTVADQPESYAAGRIHLKNMLRTAKEELEMKGWLWPAIETLLAPASAFLNDQAFWRNQREGLAIFLSMDFFKTVRCAEPFEPDVDVSRNFYIRPLLPLLSKASTYYVLALSQNNVRLLLTDYEGITEIPLLEMPTSLEEALKYDDPEKRLQSHGGGASGPIYHGHSPIDERSSNLLRFVQQLDVGLTTLTQDTSFPIVLAAAEPLRSIFLNKSAVKRVLPTTVDGNPDAVSNEGLIEAAKPIVDELAQREVADAIERFMALSGSNEATSDMAEIVAAAHYGQIDTLFVSNGTTALGNFEMDTGEITLVDSAESDATDLVDLAVVKTLESNGKVYAVGRGRPSMTAILRYSISAD